MLFRKILKISPFVVLTLLNVNALRAYAGGVSGGGGDASEPRVNEIRADILSWIAQGGAQGLRLPQGMTLETYQSQMSAMLVPHAVVIGFVTSAQEAATDNPELKVSVNGQPKTCRGFVSVADTRPHILCNTERFAATGEAEQYRLVHHEYAGLAGVEQNVGASSDYQVSDQLTQYLVPETVLRLAVNRGGSTNVDTSTIFGSYELLSTINGTRPCNTYFGMLDYPNADEIGVYLVGAGSFRSTEIGKTIWQTTPWESYGITTQSLVQNASNTHIILNTSSESVFNPSSNGFGRTFRRNQLRERESISLTLDRATGVLTFVLNRQGFSSESLPDRTVTQVCLMKKVR